MIVVENAQDFEFYSANSAGGIQGLGYECRNDGQVYKCLVPIIEPDHSQATSHPDGDVNGLVTT